MLAIGYASPYLRLGVYVMRKPMIRVEAGKVISLERFEQEAERIIFIDGYIELRHKDFPNLGEERIELTIDTLLEVIGTRLPELEFIKPN